MRHDLDRAPCRPRACARVPWPAPAWDLGHDPPPSPPHPQGPDGQTVLEESPMLKWLLDLFAAGRLAAKEVCTCAWHCKDANLGVQHLALDPRKKGQNHARVLERGLGLAKFTQTAVLWEDVPMFDKYNMDTNDGRDLRPLPIVVPHWLVQKGGCNRSRCIHGPYRQPTRLNRLATVSGMLGPPAFPCGTAFSIYHIVCGRSALDKDRHHVQHLVVGWPSWRLWATLPHLHNSQIAIVPLRLPRAMHIDGNHEDHHLVVSMFELPRCQTPCAWAQWQSPVGRFRGNRGATVSDQWLFSRIQSRLARAGVLFGFSHMGLPPSTLSEMQCGVGEHVHLPNPPT